MGFSAMLAEEYILIDISLTKNMKVGIIIVLMFLTSLHHSIGQEKNPYLDLKFDKVMFYDFLPGPEKGSLIIDNNNRPLQSITKKIELDSTTIKTFNSKLGRKASFGNVTASCFDPHCGFVYFFNNKPVAQITICLECNRLRSSIELPAQQQGKQGQGDDAYYISDGLSKSFRKHINDLLTRHGFSHQIKLGSSFDK